MYWGVSEELFPIVNRVLPRGWELGVMPSNQPNHLLERIEILKDLPAENPGVMDLTLDDDNIGVVPQLTTNFLPQIVQVLKSNGWSGFVARERFPGDHDWPLAYLAKAAWDAQANPNTIGLDLLSAVCGKDCAANMMTIFHEVESVTTYLSDSNMNFSKERRGTLMKYWRPGPVPTYLAAVRNGYQRALTAAERAREKATSGGGRAFVDYWVGRLEFSAGYVDTCRGSIWARPVDVAAGRPVWEALAMSATTPVPTDPHQYLATQVRWRWIEMVFWLATLLPFVLTPSYLVLASQIAITALFALSLDLILGYAGIVSLGHAAFFGWSIQAGIVSKYGWGEPLTGLLLAGFAAGLLGYLMSFIIARFRHLALIMLTLGFGFLLLELANSMGWLTGGADGLQGVRMWPLLGMFKFDLWGYTSYWYALIVLFLLFLVCRRLINSPFGLSLRGIRENVIRMRAIGAESHAHLRKIYTISAAVAGVAGGLLTQTTETVSLGVLDFQRSADILVILILGGAGRLYGGLIGAIIFMVARDQFSGINPQYWYFPIGLLLIAVVLFLPNGILGGLAQIGASERFQRWRGRLMLGRSSSS